MNGRPGLVLGALLSHWRRRPLQFVMLVAGLMLATALWSGVQAVNAEARASYARAADQLGAGALDRLEPAPGQKLTVRDYVALRRAGWLVSPLVEGRLRTDRGSVGVLGVDPVTRPVFGPVGEGNANGGGNLLAFITPPATGYADAATVAALGDADLSGLTLASRDGMPPNTVVMDVGIAQRLLELGDRLSALTVAASQPAGLQPLDEIAPQLIRREAQDRADPAALTASFHLNLTAFALLSFIVGLFITQSAVGLAFEQRRGVVRTLRALGV